ncbi:hypothetical protein F1559_004204 [Cyanidiococcus yangmingshanensis]|uniref:Uncharacterized protein n=1 Tax=Cyanidiococcus yangmingshanensis TaxID=2690220 RepID=A0A7J7IHH6_9RHOD|nr:hypothetical protein F1559_004204 [Cyanidiococcus yangmingshanensis]
MLHPSLSNSSRAKQAANARTDEVGIRAFVSHQVYRARHVQRSPLVVRVGPRRRSLVPMEEKAPVVDLGDFIDSRRKFERDRLAHRRKQLDRRRRLVQKRLRNYRRSKERSEEDTSLEVYDSERSPFQKHGVLTDEDNGSENHSAGGVFAAEMAAARSFPKRYRFAFQKGLEVRAERERQRVEYTKLQQKRAEERQKRQLQREFQRQAHLRRTKKGQPLLHMQVQALLQRLEKEKGD